MNSLLNRKQVKQFALDTAQTRARPFTRVSSRFYDKVEANLREYIRRHIHSLPSSGKTIE